MSAKTPKGKRQAFAHFRCRPRVTALEDRTLPGFLAPLSYDTGSSPRAVAVGDFNGDGIPDLAVANQQSSTVSVLLGTGAGSFQPARNFPVTGGANSVVTGDFNGDGSLDLAVASFGGVVDVLLGNGDGTFQPARTFAAGSYPDAIAVGDFNGDGVPDLVVANEEIDANRHGAVSVLLGKGDGSFQEPVSYAAGTYVTSVAVGDFNGDGVQELVVTNADSNTVGVLLGKGDGSFQPAQFYTAVAGPSSVAVADFNGDGILDLVTANTGPNYTRDSVSVLLGQGNGSFQDARDFSTGYGSASVAVADFNGDGLADFAVTSELDGMVNVFLGTGDGSFQDPRNLVAGSYPASVVVADFNGDGIPDLAMVNYTGVTVLAGNGDGSFQATPSYPAGPIPYGVAVGDFNGDGVPDLAVADWGDLYGRSGSVSVLLGNGDGTFQPARTYATGVTSFTVAVGDFNGDGVLDLAVANRDSANVSVLLGNGDGTFQPAHNFAAGDSPVAVAVGDFNGDGKLDLVVIDNIRNVGTASVLLGNGDGTFQPARTFFAGSNPYAVAVGDLTGTGVLDLVVADSYHGGTVVLLGNGDGTFQPYRDVPTHDQPGAVALGDFNGDGILDIAVGVYTGVDIALGNGDGTFRQGQSVAFSPGARALAVGDFNGDGIPDLAAASIGGVRVLLGNGDGSFQTPPVSYLAGAIPQAIAVGDFNGDGWPDLAVANSNLATNDPSNTVSILLNDTAWPPAPGRAGPHRPPRHRDEIEPGGFLLPPPAPPRPVSLTAHTPANSRATAAAARDDDFRTVPTDGLAPATPRPIAPRRAALAVDLLAGGLRWDDESGWTA